MLEQIERRGYETQQAAVDAAVPMLKEGLVVQIVSNGDKAARARRWVLLAWEEREMQAGDVPEFSFGDGSPALAAVQS